MTSTPVHRSDHRQPNPDYVRVIRIHGPFLSGTTEQLAAVAVPIDDLPLIVILRLRNMTAIDATGLMALEDLATALHAKGRELVLCGARPQPAKLLRDAGFEEHVGKDNICPHISAALERVRTIRERGESAAATQAMPH